MKTYGELTAEVLRYGFDDGPQVNKKRIEDWLNEGQRAVAAEVQAPEFQETATVTMTVGSNAITLPTGVLKVQSIRSDEQEWRLAPIDLQKFDSLLTLESTPTHYTLYKQELWLWPTPIVAETLKLRYIKDPAKMEAESDVPTLDEANLYLLVRYALVRAFEAEDDMESAKYHEGRYERELKQYASQVQDRLEDRPRQLEGTWGGF